MAKNTPTPTICSKCGAEDKRGKLVRIRNNGPAFIRNREKRHFEEDIWSSHEFGSDNAK